MMDKKSADADAMLQQADNGVTYRKNSTWFGRTKVLALIVLVIGVIFLIVGIALIASARKSACIDSKDSTQDSTGSEQFCRYSDEANRIGFGEFIDRVRKTYFKLHKYNVIFDPDLGTDFESFERVKVEFQPYNPAPQSIKERTDASWDLLKEINEKTIQVDKLKPRERKALEQVKHYLKHIFGQPYDVNYYAGDWMLGPNLFCWQPVCYMGYSLYNALLHFKPLDLLDADLIKTKLQLYETTLDQYVSNMKLGVIKGMIRSVDECKAGLNAISRNYLNISLYNETGVLKEWYAKPLLDAEYYSQLSDEMNEEWKKNHNNKNVSESMKEYLIEYIGKPITNMLRYLKEEHLPHCVPSSVSSGLASLPVKYVYTNGVANTSWPTDPTLPLTNQKLDGKKTYEMIMPYFTTNNMTPDEVHQLGWMMLNILYPKVVEIAKEVTKIHNDSDLAVERFREVLNSSESYFDDPIPKNESDENAHRKCSDLAGAEKYCPARWAAIQKWFKEARKVMSMLDPKIVKMFYFTGTKHTTPNCPVDLRPDLNPSSGAQSYDSSGTSCSKSAIYNIPFFLGRMGPRYSEWSVNAHEARPGHHLQVQGNIEHFRDSCGGSIGWLDSETYYTAFTEGWALYAENPLIAEDTDTYKNEVMQKFGMLKWQLWRAIRLIVDTGLHYKGMNRSEALRLFDERAWDGTDLAQKEVTRYQSDPGQATAYMIGQLDIKKAREYATKELGKDFDLKEFHYQVLSQGSSPLGYLTDHIRRYVKCKKDSSKTGCQDILSPPKTSSSSGKEGKKKPLKPIIRPPKRHYI